MTKSAVARLLVAVAVLGTVSAYFEFRHSSPHRSGLDGAAGHVKENTGSDPQSVPGTQADSPGHGLVNMLGDDSDFDVPASDGDLSPSVACTTLEDYLNGPDAYRLDVWNFSWGAPPVGNNTDPARAYAQYDDDTLDGLIDSGDSLASHERGLSLIWAGLNGRHRVPKGVTLWDLGSDQYPYSSHIDADALQRGRVLLYESAVKGRSYDLIRIGLSFAHERESRLARGVDKSTLDTLEVQKIAYLMAAKNLVPGLGEKSSESSVPARLQGAADSAMNDIINLVKDDRKKEGIPAFGRVDDVAPLWKSLNICRNS